MDRTFYWNNMTFLSCNMTIRARVNFSDFVSKSMSRRQKVRTLTHKYNVIFSGHQFPTFRIEKEMKESAMQKQDDVSCNYVMSCNLKLNNSSLELDYSFLISTYMK